MYWKPIQSVFTLVLQRGRETFGQDLLENLSISILRICQSWDLLKKLSIRTHSRRNWDPGVVSFCTALEWSCCFCSQHLTYNVEHKNEWMKVLFCSPHLTMWCVRKACIFLASGTSAAISLGKEVVPHASSGCVGLNVPVPVLSRE